jgi:DNA-binding transcriptional ArsR family regulator
MTDLAPAFDAALRALADGNRRRILSLVRDRADAVGEIADRVSMSQQAVSHDLRVLRGAGLVAERREGTRHLSRVRTDGLRVVEEFLRRVLADSPGRGGQGSWPSPSRGTDPGADNWTLEAELGRIAIGN